MLIAVQQVAVERVSSVTASAAEMRLANGQMARAVLVIKDTGLEAPGLAGRAIKEIGDSISGADEINTSSAAAMEEQGAATGEISHNVQEAASGSREVATRIEELSRTSREAGDSSARVLDKAESVVREADQ